MTATSHELPPIRRIVTGHDHDGKAVVWIDGPATNKKYSGTHVTSTLMWATDEVPSDFTGDVDEGARILGTVPPEGGTRFCVIDFKPGNAGRAHATDTIDYVICLFGEIDMHLDDSVVHLKPGDITVQRGTNHCFVNRSNETVRLAFVLVDGKPKRSGSVSGDQGPASHR